jgi:7-cyano-7-deazaguanine synthase in queuosine biosynthesis
VRRATVAEAGLPTLHLDDGRLRLPFRVDKYEHTVHALYHDPPDLPDPIWKACIEALSMACLVDLSTASLACEARFASFSPGYLGRKLFGSAAAALRLEVIASQKLSMNLLPITVSAGGRAETVCPPHRSNDNRVLLLMGGGKDSLYTYYLLRRAGYEVRCFYVTEARRNWQQLRRVYNALQSEVAQDRVYLDVNRRGPVDRRYGDRYLSQFQIGQAIFASMPYAFAHGCRYIALGLERSSDTPMFHYERRPVNHQHQKSSSFIRQMNRYLAWKFHNAVEVVSPLHGLYDSGIYARFLTAAPSLVFLQSSCGGANGRSPHCGRCEKCAFLAALLAGLGDDKDLYKTLFPRDPLDDPQLYEGWLSPDSDRPLTCAGFADEIRLALALARTRGWRSKVLDQASTPSAARNDLASFLACHPNLLVPERMGRRLAPYLRLRTERWTSRLTGFRTA